MLSNKIEKMYGDNMDRRKRKTRDAIFSAFISLLSKRDYNAITVGDIIEKADVGRATFYDHFETKDYLLKELCGELFDHVFDAYHGVSDGHKHIFDCDAPDSVFLHLLEHLCKNDNNIMELLSSNNNELFLGYFKENLKKLVASQPIVLESQRLKDLPKDYVCDFVTSTFVSTVKWWIDGGMKETSTTIHGYFLTAVQ